MKAQLVCDALKMAIWQRRPKAGLIHHSDRGSQYASKAFRRLLKANGVKGSMSRKGDCWDTQSTILSSVQSNLTRAGIGEAAFALTCRLDTGVPRVSPGPLPVT